MYMGKNKKSQKVDIYILVLFNTPPITRVTHLPLKDLCEFVLSHLKYTVLSIIVVSVYNASNSHLVNKVSKYLKSDWYLEFNTNVLQLHVFE